MLGPEREIEDLKAQVARYFPVYEVRVRPDMLMFFVHVEPVTLDSNFDQMRKSLVPKGYIPYITKDKGEHVVLIQRKPRLRVFGVKVNLILLVITISTTVFAGALNWAGYDNRDIFDPMSFAYGALFFALPLMAILGIHEMGHYITAKKHHVAASLPFFIPSIPPLGTFGALISMRDPIPNRKALLDIGIAGPLYGLAVAIPVTLLGFFLITLDPKAAVAVGGGTVAHSSLLYDMLALLVPVPSEVKFHPTAFAGWVGLFVTALNLLPAGQLDGGHVARAVLGDNSRYLSYFALAVMFFLGMFFQGWFIIAIFILLLGARHPPPLNDITKLTTSRKAVGVVALVVFVATFIPQPLEIIPYNPDFTFEAPQPLVVNVTHGATATASFILRNSGNVPSEFNVSFLDLGNMDNAEILVQFLNYSGSGGNATVNGRNFTVSLASEQFVNVTFFLNATNHLTSESQPYTFRVRAVMLEVEGPRKDLQVEVRVY